MLQGRAKRVQRLAELREGLTELIEKLAELRERLAELKKRLAELKKRLAELRKRLVEPTSSFGAKLGRAWRVLKSGIPCQHKVIHLLPSQQRINSGSSSLTGTDGLDLRRYFCRRKALA